MNNGDLVLHEANQLRNLATNSTLLDYSLQMGIIQKVESTGQLTIDRLNMAVLSADQIFNSILVDHIIRLGMFISSVSLVSQAIRPGNQSRTIRELMEITYIGVLISYQIVNFDQVSIRTLNRLLVCVSIVFFSLTTLESPICDDLRNFKDKIRHRLSVDFFMWCILFGLGPLLAHETLLQWDPLCIGGRSLRCFQASICIYCINNLAESMIMIGHGKLVPLVVGTPILLLDSGSNVQLLEVIQMTLLYLRFWNLSWRRLFDWNHPMLCEAGICKMLNTGKGKLELIREQSEEKFNLWLSEEGLNEDGWFLLLDPPVTTSRATQTNIPEPQAPSQDQESDDPEMVANEAEQVDDVFQDRIIEEQQFYLDYGGRAIYLHSRHPLLTTLAIVILLILK